jgi:hypothetical protein
MAKAKPSLFEWLVAPAAPEAPPASEASPPPPARADLWMLGPHPTYQRRIAFTDSVGGRFGDIGLTTRFCLDNWSQSPNGFRWTLDPSAVTVPEGISPRAAELLTGCFARTVSGLYKRAAVECDGDLEAAICRAIDEQMTMLGLDRYIPDEPQEAW